MASNLRASCDKIHGLGAETGSVYPNTTTQMAAQSDGVLVAVAVGDLLECSGRQR